MASEETSWLLLIHQVPNSPSYLRVKMWRRLQKVGAVPVKNAVYVLPRSDQSIEDFHWIAREIIESGGDASVCEATFIEGITTGEVVELFRSARQADYSTLISEIEEIDGQVRKSARAEESTSGSVGSVSRLREKLTEIESIDFFGCPEKDQAESLLTSLERNLRKAPLRKSARPAGSYSGRTWVTRKGIYVDRIASAWLIRRFIDPSGRFKFVPAKGYRPEPGEVRFDMFDAEFTHEGELCTFEVLLERFNISDRAMKPIAEIIHDIDLKDSKFGRPETPGMALIVNALCTANKEDMGRLERGSAFLDDLYEYFKKH
jgi:hypothetical protein